jgi:hypothetical protein
MPDRAQPVIFMVRGKLMYWLIALRALLCFRKRYSSILISQNECGLIGRKS